MKYLVVLFFIFFGYISYGQYYTVSAFQDEYVEIEDYNSIMIETMGNIFFWEKQIELDFEFPYFEHNFNNINLASGEFSFDNTNSYSDLLFYFYSCDIVLDTVNIESDIRYKLMDIDGVRALVVQYTKNRLFIDPSVEEYDSNINFQQLFFENGTIEVRFGNSNLENSPTYIPGLGFLSGLSDTLFAIGPAIELRHPFDTTAMIGYTDINSYKEYEVRYDNNGILKWWPPEGWVIRFENDYVASTDIEQDDDDIRIYPNPVHDRIQINADSEIQSINVLTLDGKLVKTTNMNNTIDVSDVKSGIYMLRIVTEDKVAIKKFVKI